MKILGHAHLLQYLKQGLQQNRLSPSLIFVGPDGVGKKTCAIELAKCFSCTEPSQFQDDLPRCDRCAACHRVSENNHADLFILDRATQAIVIKEKPESQTAIKIEAIRHIDKFLHLKPTEASRRTVIIDEAHKMTNDAANAMLKLLEEPPNNAQLVLIAQDEHSLPSTILSRCAILRVRPVSVQLIADWLSNRHSVAEDKAMEVADLSGGSFEKALKFKDEQQEAIELSEYSLEEFFKLLAQTNWRREGRKHAERAVLHLIESAQKKLEQGDLSQGENLKWMFHARKQIDRHVSPKLALENLYLKLHSPFKE